ncbi:hypothetical protein DFH09DRAFT_937860 [Mycena vulgaris]|nr:hypothetical protein DFH09DRAFT_937860 [Mycena vulgaris]
MTRASSSEVSSNTFRRAHAVHPIAAVEYSRFRLNIELGVAVFAYSPLGRGLTGVYVRPTASVNPCRG